MEKLGDNFACPTAASTSYAVQEWPTTQMADSRDEYFETDMFPPHHNLPARLAMRRVGTFCGSLATGRPQGRPYIIPAPARIHSSPLEHDAIR